MQLSRSTGMWVTQSQRVGAASGRGVPVGDAVEVLAHESAQVLHDARFVERQVDLPPRPQAAQEHQQGGPQDGATGVIDEVGVTRVGELVEVLGESGGKDAASCG